MMKALKELTGISTPEIGKMISSILDAGIRRKIAEEIGYQTESPTMPSHKQTLESAISSMLGDEEPEDSSSITDEMLENDLNVEDPEHEAKAEADVSEQDGYYFLGEGFLDPRVSKRKKSPVKIKGKVTPYSGDGDDSGLY